jgi:HlyD family secretion protein
MKTNLQDPRRSIRRLNSVGFATLAVLVVGVGGWAATSRLSGAVIASGSVVVESNIKKIQHPTGGVVGEILVREGDLVEYGQVLLRLDDTVTRSTLAMVRSQLDELTSRAARLLAERDGDEIIIFPAELSNRLMEPTLNAAVTGEEKLFHSRKGVLIGQRAQLRERISQFNEEIGGLTAQQEAKEAEVKFIGDELVGTTALYQKNLVNIQRFMQLQREQARLQGERGHLIAESARSRAKISETELQIIQLEQDFGAAVLKDLREAQGKIAEFKERVTAAEDQLRRVDLRAPQAGIVTQLTVHTVGGVIANGDTVMQIVPRADKLVIEAKVAPSDIDQVDLGAPALVRISAGNQRTAPDLNGVVIYVAADLTREKDARSTQAYFIVRASLTSDEIGRLGDMKLLPGMPAEIFIQTHEQTLLQYLLKPLSEQISRTFRER